MAIRPSSGVLPWLCLAGALSYACGQSSNQGNPDGGGAGGGSSGAGTSSGSGGASSGASSGGASSGGASSGGASSGGSTGGSSGGASGGGSSSGGGSGANAVSVLQHHMNPTRDGVYKDSSITTTTGDGGAKTLANPLKLDTTFAPTITGAVYAQPLYVTNGPGGKEAFIVVTEANHVMAIGSTGATIWEHPSSATDTTSYGTTARISALGCGDIDPLGITGTPVIDASARVIYFDAMTGPTPTHKIYAVSLDDGTIKSGWPVVVDNTVTGFVSKSHNQRGALALVNGTLYVPYGGHDGDCGTYNGWVVGVNVSSPSSVTAFSTGTVGAGSQKGGIWSPGGVAATMDGSSLFVSTGNTTGAMTWAGGEAVLKLTAGPTFTNQATDEFYPTEWLMDDQFDLDLGGANPVVVDMPNPSGGTLHLIVIPGKDGYLYVLNRDNLGGVGAQISRTAVAPQNIRGQGSINAASAVYTTTQGTYVAYHINSGPAGTGCPSGGGAQRSIGVAKLTGNPVTPKVVWCTTESGMGSPIVTMTANGDAIVWDANTHLYGYDGDTGATVYAGTDTMASPLQFFNTPIDAGGRIVVAGTAGHLYVFK